MQLYLILQFQQEQLQVPLHLHQQMTVLLKEMKQELLQSHVSLEAHATESGTQTVTITINEDDSGPSFSINDVTTSNEMQLTLHLQ